MTECNAQNYLGEENCKYLINISGMEWKLSSEMPRQIIAPTTVIEATSNQV